MAENIRDIKRRIKSVNSTKQITHAMELVASSKLRKARMKAEARKAYFDTMLSSMREMAAQAGKVKSVYLQEREVKKTLYVVITADRGLAGGYNANVIKSVTNAITDKEKACLVTLGTKGRDYFRKRGYEVIKDFTGMSEQPTYANASEVGKQIMEMYVSGEVDEVVLAYTEFVSTITQKANNIKLLPISPHEFDEEKKTEEGFIPLIMTYEPSPEALLDYLIPKYIWNTVYGAMIEGSASEQGARRMAMETATENANEMIDVLTLHYNRARQAQITQELTEIIGGAEALK
ncbi:ATP synthase F1 subunit gamma [Alkalibacter saccharofermentans]|uniref:ATP synthase gamma chain n=1 Tax=Alkalibacter saccharofermentans DSM 14828 TaxID=1120975 RepID=A0A1M5A800_9FIRM|nr:ATP synthase F1 subunit gamma [Alkalibacter saccharofermentans]SHF26408.1 ATP synthase F1 subcomplex gamma subunit [Alkalibacter saccharofermentans DSM 14828]